MSNEIYCQTQLSATKAGVTSTLNSSFNLDLTSDERFQQVQEIGTSNESLNIGAAEITTPKIMALKNLDATNFVDIYLDSGSLQHIARLTAGQTALIPLPPSPAYYAKADTAAVELQVLVLGD